MNYRMINLLPIIVSLLLISCTTESGGTVQSNSFNSKPTANAGADIFTAVGASNRLDGSGSSDPESDPLTYQWTIFSKPSASISSLSDATSDQPTFIPGVSGDYVLQLVVNDGVQDSAEDSTLDTTSDSFVLLTAHPNTLSARRTSGVAPLSVFFDSGFIGHSGSAPFHDIEYSWNFGDSTTDYWATEHDATGSSKNLDKGPLAAHVFNNSGDYTVTVTSKDVSGNTTVQTIPIQVEDPEIHYANSTVCFSDTSSSDFSPNPTVHTVFSIEPKLR